jgi:hypothetical protein
MTLLLLLLLMMMSLWLLTCVVATASDGARTEPRFATQ